MITVYTENAAGKYPSQNLSALHPPVERTGFKSRLLWSYSSLWDLRLLWHVLCKIYRLNIAGEGGRGATPSTMMISRARSSIVQSCGRSRSHRLLSSCSQAHGNRTAVRTGVGVFVAVGSSAYVMVALSEEDRLDRWKDRWQKNNIVSVIVLLYVERCLSRVEKPGELSGGAKQRSRRS